MVPLCRTRPEHTSHSTLFVSPGPVHQLDARTRLVTLNADSHHDAAVAQAAE